MKTSKQITELRKAGKLDEAYRLSLDLIASPTADDRDRAAYAWCLIDLVRRSAGDRGGDELQGYLNDLLHFEVPDENTVLAKHRTKVLARGLSKQGRFSDAIRIYAELQANGGLDDEGKTSWGWDLYRLVNSELRSGNSEEFSLATGQRVRRYLNDYLKLQRPGVDLLHSLMLRQALRLARSKRLKALPFLRLWGPDKFSDEDYSERLGQDGKMYPPLAVTAIRRAAAEAVDSGRAEDLKFILPHLEYAMGRFSENSWLKHSMVKVLRGLRRGDEARELAIKFAREKANEFWVWDLMGDLVHDEPSLRLSCYAKALSCSQDDGFVGKVRLKFASLVSDRHPSEARFEVERVLIHRRQSGFRIPAEAEEMSRSTWFQSVSPASTGNEFYTQFTDEAEALLFDHLPWTDASLGEVFVILGKDRKKATQKRLIYLKGGATALEGSLPASHPDICNLADGAPLSVQFDSSKTDGNRILIHRVRLRPEGLPMDVLPEVIGVVDHVNTDKGLIHVVVDREIDGTCPISELPGKARAGLFVKVRVSKYQTRTGSRSRMVQVAPTEDRPPEDVCRCFHDRVRVTGRGLGFTEGDIFIPPQLVAQSGIVTGHDVEGLAVISFDKKHRKWGWKAIRIARAGHMQ